MERCPRRQPGWVGILLLILLLPAAVASAEPLGMRLGFDDLSEWTEKSFKGHTAYSRIESDAGTVLQATARGTASGLYHKVTLSAAEYPFLAWSWKVRETLAAENSQSKDGDDFAARVYVVFPGRFFWQTRALVYVWSDKLPVGAIVPSAFTPNIAIIAIESGNRYAGFWRQERRNYVGDYRAYFHAPPPNPVAVAIMTDGDNTGSEAAAWYGELIFSRVAGLSVPSAE